MQRLLSFFMLLSFIFFYSCSKENGKLVKGTDEYKFAVEISKKLPFLDPEENNILVSTKNFNITTGDIVSLLHKNLGKDADRVKSLQIDALKQIFKDNSKNLAEKKILLQQAEKENVEVPESKLDSVLSLQYERLGGQDNFINFLAENGIDFDYVKEEMIDELKVELYLDRHVKQFGQVSESEIREEYNRDKTATVRHILLKTGGKSAQQKEDIYNKLSRIRERALNGEDFATLAKVYSEDEGSKNEGGLIKEFGKGMTVKPFEEVSFTLPVGEVSEIIETMFGYHIIKVVERKKETRPYEEVKDQIEDQIRKDKENEAYLKLLNDLRDEYQVKEIDF